MIIDRETILFGSFSKNAGNNGCKIFNTCFQFDKINAIYKSFSVDDVDEFVAAAKCLKMGGFAVSMPYKKAILDHLDVVDDLAKNIQSCNTVVIEHGMLKGYNTDYLAIETYLQKYHDRIECIHIIGDGCYASNVVFYCMNYGIKYKVISRKLNNWHILETVTKSLIFNCTPVDDITYHESNTYIDCISTTNTGKELAYIQASHQYKLYTGNEFPLAICVH